MGVNLQVRDDVIQGEELNATDEIYSSSLVHVRLLTVCVSLR